MIKKRKKYLTLFITPLFLVTLSLGACETATSSSTSQNITFEDEYVIVLKYNDGTSRPHTLYVEKGASINESDIDIPTREGYTFSGWTTDEEGTNYVAFPYTPMGDETFFAKWSVSVIDVTFDFNIDAEAGITPASYILSKDYNSNVTQQDVDEVNALVPEWPGHIFANYWETENGTRVNFDEPYNIKKEVTFYAHWRIEDTKVYNVTFDENYEGGQTYLYSDLEEGMSISLKDAPKDPSRTGYDFLGWATTADATEPDITFPYEPSGAETDITIYGVWKVKTYTITFRYNYKGNPGGATGIYQQLKDQPAFSKLSEPTPASRADFEFLGWFTHAYEGQKVTFPYEVTASTNFYAHWRANRMTPVNNIFDAEFTPIRSDETFPGYSGSTLGTGIIQPDASDDFGAYSDAYPLLDDAHPTAYGNFVTYLYKKGATLTYNIYSDRAVSGVGLYAKLATEIAPGGFTIAPEGDYGYQFIVNDVSMDYGEVDLSECEPAELGQDATRFMEFYICDISLVEGLNVIKLVTNNENTELGGTMGAVAPEVDYIRLDTTANLSWHPEYDNLYRD